MKININGVTREMTPEEIAEHERIQAELPPITLTPEERLAALEAQNAQLAEQLAAAKILLGVE